MGVPLGTEIETGAEAELEPVVAGGRWRRGVLLAVGSVAIFLAGLLVGVVIRPDVDRDARLSTGGETDMTSPAPPESTTGVAPVDSSPDTTAFPASTTLPASTAPSTSAKASAKNSAGTRTMVTEDRAKGWALFVTTSVKGRCLQFEVDTFRSELLLCDSPPAAKGKLLGDLVGLNTPVGRATVAIIEPSIDGWNLGSPYPSFRVPVTRDPEPEHAATAYGVVVQNAASASSNLNAYFWQGDNTIGSAKVPYSDAVVSPGTSLVYAGKPYGVWPGFRVAGSTGLFYGGNEMVGFYDGADGTRCLLYRRLGGSQEALLVDECPPRQAGKPIVLAKVYRSDLGAPPTSTSPPTYVSGSILVVLVDDPTVTRWTCALDDGSRCDPGGFGGSGDGMVTRDLVSDRTMLAHFPGPMNLGNAKTITVTAHNGTLEVDEVVIDLAKTG